MNKLFECRKSMSFSFIEQAKFIGYKKIDLWNKIILPKLNKVEREYKDKNFNETELETLHQILQADKVMYKNPVEIHFATIGITLFIFMFSVLLSAYVGSFVDESFSYAKVGGNVEVIDKIDKDMDILLSLEKNESDREVLTEIQDLWKFERIQFLHNEGIPKETILTLENFLDTNYNGFEKTIEYKLAKGCLISMKEYGFSKYNLEIVNIIFGSVYWFLASITFIFLIIFFLMIHVRFKLLYYGEIKLQVIDKQLDIISKELQITR